DRIDSIMGAAERVGRIAAEAEALLAVDASPPAGSGRMSSSPPQRPSRVAQEALIAAASVTLVDIATRMNPAGAQRIMDFMRARPDGFVSLDEASDAIAEYYPHRPRPRDPSGLAKNLRQGDDGRWRWHWDPRFMAIEGRPDAAIDALDQAAAALAIPTLLVRGKQSDLLTMEGVEHFLQLAPDTEFCDVSGAGHMVAGDKNDIFSDAVLGFLRRLDD
ncbi:MAG: alpha/beta hydrolase, partial [bacterium]